MGCNVSLFWCVRGSFVTRVGFRHLHTSFNKRTRTLRRGVDWPAAQRAMQQHHPMTTSTTTTNNLARALALAAAASSSSSSHGTAGAGGGGDGGSGGGAVPFASADTVEWAALSARLACTSVPPYLSMCMCVSV